MSRRRRARPYRQSARAEAAEATAERIVDAFGSCLRDRWFDEVTLEEVAEMAGVTVRTVIRRFGSKSGLLAAFVSRIGPEVRARITATPGDIEGAVDRVLALYEELGDSAIRNLAEESRLPELQPLIDLGRREHRSITVETFAPLLREQSEERKGRTVDALVVATDVYTWKLLRRDMGRSLSETRTAMLALVRAILGSTQSDPPGEERE